MEVTDKELQILRKFHSKIADLNAAIGDARQDGYRIHISVFGTSVLKIESISRELIGE